MQNISSDVCVQEVAYDIHQQIFIISFSIVHRVGSKEHVSKHKCKHASR